MILITKAGADMGAADAEIARLAALLDDLKRLASGGLPTDAELRDAPFLDGWTLSQRPVPCLTGRVSGHPVLGGPTVRTSDVWALAPGLGFARTLSRLYALGRPHASVAVPFRKPARH
ncbi:DUF6634 family protein [Falsiroseomonas bella]|nr:DUF6634 family protein [Falsiroseomonas bella]